MCVYLWFKKEFRNRPDFHTHPAQRWRDCTGLPVSGRINFETLFSSSLSAAGADFGDEDG